MNKINSCTLYYIVLELLLLVAIPFGAVLSVTISGIYNQDIDIF